VTILLADQLAKRFRNREVLHGVSLEISRGEIVGLLGPNGAGKTTCFYMIVGLIPCERGRIMLNDRNITRYPMHQRARLGLGYLPQEASVFRKLSVADNLRAVLETRKDLTARFREEKIQGLMEELHIAHLQDSLGISLSGGERRRVEIARALATDPDFILLDEPFAGVDPISLAEVQRIVLHLKNQRGIGVLITDHNVRETLGICERAYIINQGTVIAEGSPQHILEDEHVRQVYLGAHFRL
jgi:lipopolysaccharide export system ATP-binding protein